MTTNPIPHRCAGLPENARAHLVALPQGDRVVTRLDCGDGWDVATLATPFCAGCGRPAEYLMTVARAEAWLAERVPLPFSDPATIEGWIGDKHYPAVSR